MSKKPNYNDPKIFEPLDEEEAQIMAELDQGEWVPTSEIEFQKIKEDARERARNTLRKTERATIRLTKADLDGIKIMAAKEGVGYQTLISTIIHKTVTGQNTSKI